MYLHLFWIILVDSHGYGKRTLKTSQADADRGAGLGRRMYLEIMGNLDEFCEISGKYWGIMMFCGDLYVKRFDQIYEGFWFCKPV